MKKRMLLLISFFSACFLSLLTAQDYDVYISDAGNYADGQILKFDQNGQNGVQFVTSNVDWPQDIFFIEDENVMLVSNLNTNNIAKFDATTGEYLGDFASGLGEPTRMELGPDGLLYVLQWTNNTKVLRFNLDGTLHDEFTQANTGSAIGLDWDSDGNLYVSSYGGNYVRKFGLDGEDLGSFIDAGLNGPTNIYFEDNGDLIVFNWNIGVVKRFDSDGNFVEDFFTGVTQCEGVDFLEDGSIMLGVGSTSSVRIYDSEGTLSSTFIDPGALDLNLPNAVVFRPLEPSSTREIFEEITFITPNIGTWFQVSNPDPMNAKAAFEVYSSTGLMVDEINFADGTWDASNLADGIYYATAELTDGVIARQKVVVLK